ncbi:hypothetical protein [Dyella japonica]|uniref:Uncharacterized protein n=1 Tax=Dyella japonica A8 TaxID=1217721 RepID=A0A075JWX3_9GAMM|nr:hypothetical protein [Dyella japonica]AIF45982.1 hypothetical protein HY57_01220 [Dyella japonica A8]
MTGTIVISSTQSADVRTIDFSQIVEEIRSRIEDPLLIAKLLDAVDGGGINMILADGLNARELVAFERALEAFGLNLGAQDHGLASFIRNVCEQIKVDRRLDSAGR